MKALLFAVGLALAVTASPVLAGNEHKGGHGKGQQGAKPDKAAKTHGAKPVGKGRFDTHRAAFDGDGRGYWDGGQYYRDGRLFGSSCPPGLAKKRNGCLPPGHAKARFSAGQLLPVDLRDDLIPAAYRDRYTGGSYRYDNGYVYRVNPKTFVIEQVIAAVLR